MSSIDEFLKSKRSISTASDAYRVYEKDIIEMIDRKLPARLIHEYLVEETDIESLVGGLTYQVNSNRPPEGYKKGDRAPVKITLRSTQNFLARFKKELERRKMKQAKEVYILSDGDDRSIHQSKVKKSDKPDSKPKTQITEKDTEAVKPKKTRPSSKTRIGEHSNDDRLKEESRKKLGL